MTVLPELPVHPAVGVILIIHYMYYVAHTVTIETAHEIVRSGNHFPAGPRF